jgi:hypothetical protein
LPSAIKKYGAIKSRVFPGGGRDFFGGCELGVF